MTRSKPWDRILKSWKRSRIALRPGASTADIEAFQRRQGVVLPMDVRDYLLTVDGFDEGECDDELFRFWPLAEIVPVHEFLAPHNGLVYPDQWAYPDCFVFADHSLDAWNYAVKLTTDPEQPAPVYCINCNDGQVAPSFLEFMERYARDPESIY